MVILQQIYIKNFIFLKEVSKLINNYEINYIQFIINIFLYSKYKIKTILSYICHLITFNILVLIFNFKKYQNMH